MIHRDEYPESVVLLPLRLLLTFCYPGYQSLIKIKKKIKKKEKERRKGALILCAIFFSLILYISLGSGTQGNFL